MSTNSFIDIAAIKCGYKNKWFCFQIRPRNAVKKVLGQECLRLIVTLKNVIFQLHFLRLRELSLRNV